MSTLALHIPLPLSPTPPTPRRMRSVSPPNIPRPPSRSERLLKETLERDSSYRELCLERPSSPLRMTSEYQYQGRSRAGSTGEARKRPHPSRVKTAPGPVCVSPPKQPRHSASTNTNNTNTHIYMTLPHAQNQNIPPPRPRTPQNGGYAHSPTDSANGSVARKRLERALTRDASVSLTRRTSNKYILDKEREREGSPPNQHQGLSPESRTNSLESTSSELLTPSSPLPSSTLPLPSAHTTTPPPSPPFNALSAARLCASIEGVVRFSDIEGLGTPSLEDEPEDGSGARGREGKDGWKGWLWWWNNNREKEVPRIAL